MRIAGSLNPWCLKCRTPMAQKGQGRLRCKCGAKAQARKSRRLHTGGPLADPTNPYCITCRLPTWRWHSKQGFIAYRCARCRWVIRAEGLPRSRDGSRRPSVVNICEFYPYGSQDDLILAINQIVPRGIPQREDICQEMLLAIVAGESGVIERVNEFVSAHWKQYTRFNVSLDESNVRYRLIG